MLLKQTPQITTTCHTKGPVSHLSYSLGSCCSPQSVSSKWGTKGPGSLQRMMPASPCLAARSLLRKGKRWHEEPHTQFFTASPASGAHNFCQLPSDRNPVTGHRPNCERAGDGIFRWAPGGLGEHVLISLYYVLFCAWDSVGQPRTFLQI